MPPFLHSTNKVPGWELFGQNWETRVEYMSLSWEYLGEIPSIPSEFWHWTGYPDLGHPLIYMYTVDSCHNTSLWITHSIRDPLSWLICEWPLLHTTDILEPIGPQGPPRGYVLWQRVDCMYYTVRRFGWQTCFRFPKIQPCAWSTRPPISDLVLLWVDKYKTWG